MGNLFFAMFAAPVNYTHALKDRDRVMWEKESYLMDHATVVSSHDQPPFLHDFTDQLI